MAWKHKPPRTEADLRAFIGPSDEHGCWPWLGPVYTQTGYGRWRSGRSVDTTAHRAVWALLVGPIPPELTIDHVKERCGGGKPNRLCVNPAHLEVVTRRENALRGDYSGNGENMRARSSCVNGHPFEGDNFRWVTDARGTYRRCKVCDRERARAATA